MLKLFPDSDNYMKLLIRKQEIWILYIYFFSQAIVSLVLTYFEANTPSKKSFQLCFNFGLVEVSFSKAQQ